MADPTWAEAWTQTKNRINQWQKLHLFANANAANWLGLEDTLFQSLEGEQVGDIVSQAGADRAALSALLAPPNIKTSLSSHLLELARVAGIPEREADQIMPKLRDYMFTNAFSVNSRNLTFGTPAAITGTGNGRISRLTLDKYGQPIESVFLEAKRAECRLDQGQTDKHQEVFEFRGVEAEKDFLNVLGSGMQVPVTALHAGASSTQRFVQNPSFEDFTGTAPTAGVPTVLTANDQLTGWVVTTIANASVELDTTYRGYPGQPTNLYSVRFTNNNTISQVLNNTVRPTFTPEIPVYVEVAIYRDSLVTGNVVFTFGGVSKTVALGTLTNNAWNLVRIDIGANNWYRAFRTNDLTVSVALNTYGGVGHIKIDDLIVGEYTNVDGTWYVVVGGPTPFREDDFSTWSDVLATVEGIIQYWFFRAGLGYLYSNNVGAETITDPV